MSQNRPAALNILVIKVSKECLTETLLLIILAFNASPSLPLESKNLGLSGKKTRATVTSAAGRPQMATKMRQELNLNPPSGKAVERLGTI